MPAHDDSERAAVLVLMRQGLGPGAIADATGLPDRTVSRYMARWRNMAAGSNDPVDLEIASQDYRLAVRSGYLLEDWIDKAEDARDLLTLKDLTKLAGQLSITRGISIDKITRRKDSGGTNVQVNVIMETRERLRRDIDTQNGPDITPGP